jgi:hypothetical protein
MSEGHYRAAGAIAKCKKGQPVGTLGRNAGFDEKRRELKRTPAKNPDEIEDLPRIIDAARARILQDTGGRHA